MISKLKNINRYFMNKCYDGYFYKIIIVISYKMALILLGKYQKEKKEILDYIKANVSDEEYKNKKLVNKTINDILYCKFNYGTKYEEYYTFKFHLLSHEGRKSYAGTIYNNAFFAKLNNASYMEYFNIKSETYRKFKEFYKRELVALYNDNDFDKFREFLKVHGKFIRKPVDDFGGHGIKIFDSIEYDSIENLFKEVMNTGACVVEELIVQGKELAQFHPQSVNTVRIVTLRESSDKVKIAWCFLRMGMGGNNVDNMSIGGLGAMIDPETGIIYTTGRDYLNNLHIFHPDTGVQIVGFHLPEWDKLLELLHKVANVIPEVNWVGWDFAYTINGWAFVEGNSRPGSSAAQVSEFNGKKQLLKSMEKIFDEKMRENK